MLLLFRTREGMSSTMSLEEAGRGCWRASAGPGGHGAAEQPGPDSVLSKSADSVPANLPQGVPEPNGSALALECIIIL